MADKPKTVRIHGNEYVTVDERVRLVVERDGGYDMVAVRQYELAGRAFYEVTVRVAGHIYTGTSEIRFDGRGIDATSPMENAETSAVGRALGFANVGNVGSIASANEVQRAVEGEQAATNGVAHPPATSVREVRIDALMPILETKLGRQGGTRWLGEQIRAVGRERIEQLSEQEFASLLAAAKGA